MSDEKTISFEIDDKEISAKPGQTILEAADKAGVYIPRLCNFEGLKPYGACRVCTVKVNSRFQSACTQPVAAGIIVENDTDELNAIRRSIIDMLFVEGNHFCMFCERSGNCELQALAYRFGITHPQHPYQFPADRKLDASHPDIFIDRNRCILCARCVRASVDLDDKHVFDFVGRGAEKRVAVNSDARLSSTDADVTDKAIEVCPVGSLLKKREGFKIPIGERKYDHKPIGSGIEEKSVR